MESRVENDFEKILRRLVCQRVVTVEVGMYCL